MENEYGGYFGNWFLIPKAVFRDKRLVPYAKFLYGRVLALIGENGYCYASNGYFASDFETSERNIRYWLSQLQECGYIRIEISRSSTGTERKIYPLNVTPCGNTAAIGRQYVATPGGNTLPADNRVRDSLSLSLNNSVTNNNTKDKQLTDIS